MPHIYALPNNGLTPITAGLLAAQGLNELDHLCTASFGSSSSVFLRKFRTSSIGLRDITVQVPSMGESITEGTIGAILKNKGASLGVLCVDRGLHGFQHRFKPTRNIACIAALNYSQICTLPSAVPHLPAGDVVQEDDVIALLETDKVTLDIKYQSKVPGVIKEIAVAEGDTVTVGQKFVIVEENADAAGEYFAGIGWEKAHFSIVQDAVQL